MSFFEGGGSGEIGMVRVDLDVFRIDFVNDVKLIFELCCLECYGSENLVDGIDFLFCEKVIGSYVMVGEFE